MVGSDYAVRRLGGPPPGTAKRHRTPINILATAATQVSDNRRMDAVDQCTSNFVTTRGRRTQSGLPCDRASVDASPLPSFQQRWSRTRCPGNRGDAPTETDIPAGDSYRPASNCAPQSVECRRLQTVPLTRRQCAVRMATSRRNDRHWHPADRHRVRNRRVRSATCQIHLARAPTKPAGKLGLTTTRGWTKPRLKGCRRSTKPCLNSGRGPTKPG
jgi:hypothetical protein